MSLRECVSGFRNIVRGGVAQAVANKCWAGQRVGLVSGLGFRGEVGGRVWRCVCLFCFCSRFLFAFGFGLCACVRVCVRVCVCVCVCACFRLWLAGWLAGWLAVFASWGVGGFRWVFLRLALALVGFGWVSVRALDVGFFALGRCDEPLSSQATWRP